MFLVGDMRSSGNNSMRDASIYPAPSGAMTKPCIEVNGKRKRMLLAVSFVHYNLRPREQLGAKEGGATGWKTRDPLAWAPFFSLTADIGI